MCTLCYVLSTVFLGFSSLYFFTEKYKIILQGERLEKERKECVGEKLAVFSSRINDTTFLLYKSRRLHSF